MIYDGKVVSHHWCDDCNSKESGWADNYRPNYQEFVEKGVKITQEIIDAAMAGALG